MTYFAFILSASIVFGSTFLGYTALRNGGLVDLRLGPNRVYIVGLKKRAIKKHK